MREIKKLESCMTGVYISLDDYAIKSSIKCTIANIGDEIIPTSFDYSGTPNFPYEIYTKYAKGEHYANIYVEVEYKTKDLELTEDIFNTVKGIDNYIKDLKTLHHIMDIRRVACKKKNIKLNEFVWRGLLKFDLFGQTMFIFDQEFADNTSNSIKNNTVDADIFNIYCKRWSSTFKAIPKHDEVCPQCGKKWTIDNLSDYVTVEQKDYTKIGFHKDCLKESNNQKQLEEFQDIFNRVYGKETLTYKAIPNKYCSCERCSDWFVVSTSDGDIQIGWRKRVINIEWLSNYKKFTEDFNSEETTKGFGKDSDDRFIHAWNTEKAIEYIKRGKGSVIK